jgi:glycosyltransferase involved in cell wall biosynthesis
MTNTISVIIPTYNRVDTLHRAVKSVLNQTYPISEIIICDDGSDDDSFESISSLNSPIVRWINCGRNGRPAIPRNIGIKESKSSWIAFLDSDDEWLPDKIKKQFDVLLDENCLAVCSNAYRIINEINHGPYLNILQKKIGFDSLLHTNFIICSSVLIHKSLINKIPGFSEVEDLRTGQDYDLWLKISVHSNFYYVNTPLLKYYDNPNNSIRKFSNSFKRTTKEIVFNSFKIWLDNTLTMPPLYNIKKFSRAQKNTFIYKIESLYLRLLSRIVYEFRHFLGGYKR